MRFHLSMIFTIFVGHLLAMDGGIDHALVSLYVVQCDTGKVLVDQNSDLSLIPASCMKVVTTAAALQLLGTHYRFETHLAYDGFIDHTQTLRGNLYIQGGGDPCLGSERISSALSWKKQIELWADEIQRIGIQKIEGRVIGDDTKWEKARAVPSWLWEDLGNYYGAGASALSFHENTYSLFLKPGDQVGEDAAILYVDPPLPTLLLQNEVKTGPQDSGDCACIYGAEFISTQFIRGTIPAGVEAFVIKGAIPDPATTCVDLLVKELSSRGITVEQKPLRPQNKRACFHVTYSPTIGEIVYQTNQKSINLYAEHLLKKMGEVMFCEGSTSAGVKAVTYLWKSQGIDLSGFNMADGSGLSSKNLITTKQLVEILLNIKKADYFPVFFASLPQKSDQVRGKSGSLSLVNGYAGYAGNTAFAILINHCPDRQKMKQAIDLFLLKTNEQS